MGIFDKLKRKKSVKPKTTSEDSKVPQKAKDKKDTPKKDTAVKATPKKEIPKTKPRENESIQFAHTVLIRPAITEKSLRMQADNVYTFYVQPSANKHKVKMAIKEVYGFTPERVRIIKKQPTELKRWGRKYGIRKGSKKALVKLAEGQSIQLTS